MILLFTVLGIILSSYTVHGLKCYECNIYENSVQISCPIITCPEEYKFCTTTTYIPVSDASKQDCYHLSNKGADYRGNWNTTGDSENCLAWDNPYNFTYNAKDFAVRGLGNHNFCRNPDGDAKPWCYTSEYSDYSYCDIPSCFLHHVEVVVHACGWSGTNYNRSSDLGEEYRDVCDSDLCNEPLLIHDKIKVSEIDDETSVEEAFSSLLSTNQDDENSVIPLRSGVFFNAVVLLFSLTFM